MKENEHLERVEAMSTDSGQTWDLSRNDQAALRHVLGLIESLAADIAELNQMLPSEIIAHHAKSIELRKR
jgi:hypothetical protein